MRLVVNLIEYFKSYSFRRQFRRQFSTVFNVILAGTIEWYYGHCPVNSVKFEQVFQKLLMRLVWNLLEYLNIYIHLDVNSDVTSQPFFMEFCRHHRLELRQLPSIFGGVWLSTSKVYNAKHWADVVTTPADRFSFISQSIPNRFKCNFAHTIRSPGNLVRFDRVFQKLLMWCTETTLFPRRQSAEKAGRHWNSTEEVPSPHRTCVTEQLELTRQVARIERVIINTTAT